MFWYIKLALYEIWEGLAPCRWLHSTWASCGAGYRGASDCLEHGFATLCPRGNLLPQFCLEVLTSLPFFNSGEGFPAVLEWGGLLCILVETWLWHRPWWPWCPVSDTSDARFFYEALSVQVNGPYPQSPCWFQVYRCGILSVRRCWWAVLDGLVLLLKKTL